MGERGKGHLAAVIFLAFLAMIFFLAAIYIPFAGIFVNIFAPAPLIIAYLKYGSRTAAGLVAAITLALSLSLKVKIGLLFMAEHGVMALVMGEALRRLLTVEKCVLFGALAATLSMIFFTSAYLLAGGVRLFDYAQGEIGAGLDHIVRHYQGLSGAKEQGALIGAFPDKFLKLAGMSLPSLVVVGSIIGALLNYLLVRRLAKRFGFAYFEAGRALEHWSMPEHFIWVLIAAGAAMVAPVWGAKSIAMNVLIVALFAYFLQGLAIASFYLKKVPALLRYFGYALIALQPLVAFILAGLGLFDLWVDFRKIGPGGR